MSAGLLLRVLLWGWFAAAILAGHRLTLRHLPPAALAGLIPALAGLAAGGVNTRTTSSRLVTPSRTRISARAAGSQSTNEHPEMVKS